MTDSLYPRPSGGVQVPSGAWEGPFWRPQLAALKDGDAQAQRDTGHPDSHAWPEIRGFLREVEAWGRPHYAVDTRTPSGTRGLYLLPELAALYHRLARVRVGADVWIAIDPEKVKTSSGRSAFTFTVELANPDDLCRVARADAIEYTTQEDRERGKAAAIPERASSRAMPERTRSQPRLPAGGGGDEDLPF